MRAETRAKDNIEKLGMADELKENKMWDTPPLPPSLHNLVVEDEDEGDEKKKTMNLAITKVKQETISYHQTNDLRNYC